MDVVGARGRASAFTCSVCLLNVHDTATPTERALHPPLFTDIITLSALEPSSVDQILYWLELITHLSPIIVVLAHRGKDFCFL